MGRVHAAPLPAVASAAGCHACWGPNAAAVPPAEPSLPQKLKAKTQFLLERSAARDDQHQTQQQGGQGGEQWTRWKFDVAAELEEERQAPAGKQSTHAVQAGLAGRCAVTLRSKACMPVGRQAGRQAAPGGLQRLATLLPTL